MPTASSYEADTVTQALRFILGVYFFLECGDAEMKLGEDIGFFRAVVSNVWVCDELVAKSSRSALGNSFNSSSRGQ